MAGHPMVGHPMVGHPIWLEQIIAIENISTRHL
jgi:hypothetical protein